MSFNAETDRAAAAEHIVVADELYRSGRYVLCHYAAGLAVECLLRAYRYRRDPAFDARHDLYLLFGLSGMQTRLSEAKAASALRALLLVAHRWNNDYRFRDEASLRRRLRSMGVHRGVRGDFVKESARLIVAAAGRFLQIGLTAWTPS